VGTAAILRRIAATFLALTPASVISLLALSFRKREQKHKDAQTREDRGGDEACRRNLSARLKTRFKVSSDADQKEQKSQADQNQTDRFLVVGRNLHLVVSIYI
jgi:hypothetical protein